MAERYVRIGQYPDYRDEVRGTLAEILASTANPGTYAAPEDVAGCTLEMGADGLWTGASVGTLTQVQADALVASGVLASVKTATSATVNGQQVTWGGAGVGWVSANPTRLDRRLFLGTFGDSTATYCRGNDTATKDLCNTASFAPNVSQVSTALWKSVIHSPMQYRMPCLYVACGGIEGSTTTDMLTRSGSTKTGTRRAIQDVIAMRPDAIKLSCGSINDLVSFDANTTDAQIYAVADRHKTIAIQFVKSGIAVYDVGILGFSQALANIAHIRRALVMINSRIAQDAAATPGWTFIPTLGVVSDATGAYLPGMSTDGVHLNGRGAMTLGDYEYKHLSGLFTPSFDGEILNDGLADFLNPSSNIPRNSDQWNDSCANVTQSTSGGVMTVSADVTNSSTVAFKYFLSGSLSGLASGDTFYSHTRIEAAVDGVPVEFLVSSETLVYNGATLQINAAETTIMAKGDATVSLHPIKMNFAGASSGSESIMRLAVAPQTSGRLTLKIYPVTVRKAST